MSKEGTLIKTRHPFLYFDNADISSVEEARNRQQVLDSKLDEIRCRIETLVFATPKDITPKNEDPLDYIGERLNSIYEDLEGTAKEYYTIDIIRDIIGDWAYGGYSDDKEVYPNSETDEEVNKRAFIEDKHIEIKRDMNKFTFAPPDDNVSQTITRSIQNIKLNDELSEEIINQYIILLGNKPYVDYDGQFLFASKEKAENALKKKMDFHSIDYISKEFVKFHPDYFNTVIDKLSEEDKEKFKESLPKLEDGNLLANFGDFELLNKLFGDLVIKEVFEILGVKIIPFNTLINSYIS